MRVAALYDIHGNLPALESVLAELREKPVERIVIGGDVVPGPFPRECLDLLLEIDTPIDFISGNCDHALRDIMNGQDPSSVPEQVWPLMRWTASRLDGKYKPVIESWPPTLRLDVEGTGKVLFCHATPQSDRPIFTKQTAEEKLIPLFNSLDVDIVACGHTHMQFDRGVGAVRVVNAGSVGMPFGKPGAYWLLLDSGIHLRRTAYDLARAADTIRNSAYPDANTFADKNVLEPASEESILEVYSKLELK